jgi:tol-pal system protein YbgF
VDDQIKELQERVIELQRKAAVSDVELARLRQQVADLTARQGGGGAAVAAPPSRRSTLAGSSSTAPAPATGTGRRAGDGASEAGGTRGARGAEGAFSETDIEVPSSPPPPPAAAAGRRAAAPPSPPPPPTARAVPVPPAIHPTPPAPVPSATVPVPSPPAASREAAGAGAEERSEPVTPAVQALYDRGYTLYHQRHYVDAETSFQRFLQAEPRSELAPNAQYWIGECRYSRGDMRGALAAFRETVTRYPQGNKTPDALLKAAMSLEALGDREGARNTYQDVLHRFPGTAVAAVAEERRAKLP